MKRADVIRGLIVFQQGRPEPITGRIRNETITVPADFPDTGLKEALSKGQNLREDVRGFPAHRVVLHERGRHDPFLSGSPITIEVKGDARRFLVCAESALPGVPSGRLPGFSDGHVVLYAIHLVVPGKNEVSRPVKNPSASCGPLKFQGNLTDKWKQGINLPARCGFGPVFGNL
jgi:hypothetical protein